MVNVPHSLCSRSPTTSGNARCIQLLTMPGNCLSAASADGLAQVRVETTRGAQRCGCSRGASSCAIASEAGPNWKAHLWPARFLSDGGHTGPVLCGVVVHVGETRRVQRCCGPFDFQDWSRESRPGVKPLLPLRYAPRRTPLGVPSLGIPRDRRDRPFAFAQD
jgi:hypothetical protein